ncbi:MAG: pilus assembly protein [Hydrogenophaga sp.]|nr:pilus assembly protein [Hydrogenophaga sp.]
MISRSLLNGALKGALLLGALSVQVLTDAVAFNIPQIPLAATVNARPMTMLIAGRDHRLFYEAYNDASDLDGDGLLDVRFRPTIQYYGLFDSDVCYEYSGTPTANDNGATKNAELFRPVSAVTSATLRDCTGTGAGQWSGNWLNYITTSRIDALRKVLYGGMRDVDVDGNTVLRRAYIPQDAHSWGKEYRNVATDGYNIADFTSLALPTANNRRHFFGNLTATNGVNCSTLNNCSNRPPLLRMRENVLDRRIWEWASKERPVLDNSLSTGSFQSGTAYDERNYAVRVQVCTETFQRDCKRYPGGATGGNLKPIGLLHEYGENDAMLFGLITGSYDRHMTGGRLRKVVSSFANEINSTTGIFRAAANSPIVTTFNRLRIRGFNQSSSSNEYAFSDPYSASALAPTEGQFVDWGNPVGEMMLEGLRYFAGASGPSSGFDSATERTIDGQVGLTSASWDDPYAATSAARAPYCARPNFLVVSNINPSFDSDSVPGSSFNTYSDSLGNLAGLNVRTVADSITGIENRVLASTITGRQFFVGQSGSPTDNAPTPKTVQSLGAVRGLAPDEPSKQGSFYSASLAYWAKTNNIRNDLRTSLNNNAVNVNVDSYVVALSSPLPNISVTINGQSVSLVPFAKSVGGNGISANRNNYQPTNQIVDFYVEEFTPPTNATTGEGYRAVFQINFEDVEQGGDHDMDAIARYTIEVVGGQLRVTVVPTYQAGGIQQNMGFIVSGVTDAGGTSRDGVYLVARDENTSPAYFLNVPPNRWAGYCDATPMPADCGTLPTIGSAAHTYVFRPNASGSGGAQLLKDPLWYVAKYGGYVKIDDQNSAGVGPTLQAEWDAHNNITNAPPGDGVPDNYFLVQNPLNLRASLRRALENITNNSASGGNIIANSTSLDTDTYVFQATFNNNRWAGDVLAYRANSSGVSAVPDWNVASRLPKNGEASRNIFYWSDNAGPVKGDTFAWGNLSTAERALFGTGATAQNVFNYIRGSGLQEFANGGTLRDRSATTVLGDIAHSSPAFSRDSEVVFVGSNGGMLHAFSTRPLSASNSIPPGTELFAYIPSAVMPRLRNLADVSYNVSHEYFVDGDVAVSARVGSPARNYLVATLGRGGQGLFALNVTNPYGFSNNDVLWEYFPNNDATTANDDPDLGQMLGRPVLATAANGVEVVLVGNGYNSTNRSAALYVFNLATGALIRKLVVPSTGDNGLATPGVFDANNDGRIDVAYAGDMQGRVWRFDLSNANPVNWSVSNGNAPIFVARNAAGEAQPITAPMSVAINSVSVDPNFNRRFVFFGTGSYFQSGDPSNTSRQTLYSIVDDPSIPHDVSSAAATRARLAERVMTATEVFSGLRDPSQPQSASNPLVTRTVRRLAAAAAGDMSGRLGCYVDLPQSGERIVTRSNLFRLAEPTLIASSIIPETLDQCVPGGTGFLNAVNPFTCGRLTRPFFDLNDSGSFLDDALSGGDFASSVQLNVGMPGEAVIIGNRLVVGGSSGRVSDIRVNTGTTPLRGRLSWREIVRD